MFWNTLEARPHLHALNITRKLRGFRLVSQTLELELASLNRTHTYANHADGSDGSFASRDHRCTAANVWPSGQCRSRSLLHQVDCKSIARILRNCLRGLSLSPATRVAP